MKTYEVLISGRVQGVGYRYSATKSAAKHNIKGWVKNLPNGDVKVVAQGKSEDLDNFFNTLKHGTSFSRVIEFRITELNSAAKYTDFHVTY